MRGMLGLLIVLNVCFLFQQYPRHGLIQFLGMTRDIKQYLSVFVGIVLLFTLVKRNKKRFY
jgi:hypothetical protein